MKRTKNKKRKEAEAKVIPKYTAEELLSLPSKEPQLSMIFPVIIGLDLLACIIIPLIMAVEVWLFLLIVVVCLILPCYKIFEYEKIHNMWLYANPNAGRKKILGLKKRTGRLKAKRYKKG